MDMNVDNESIPDRSLKLDDLGSQYQPSYNMKVTCLGLSGIFVF